MPNLWIGGALLIWAALLLGGFVVGKMNAEHTHRIPRAGRLGSSLALVALAWALAALLSGGPWADYGLGMAVGMTLGFLGDLFMAGVLGGKANVLGGMLAFGLGHVAYIAAIVWLAGALATGSEGNRMVAWLVWLAIAAAGWWLVVWRGAQEHTALHLAALPYALLLASTAGAASGLALGDARFWPLAVGAALFLLSDLILAAQLFNGLHFRGIGDVVWLTYGPGQMLIVLSAAALLS